MDPAVLYPSALRQNVLTVVHNTVSAIENIPVLNHCAAGLELRAVSGGYVCVNRSGNNIYQQIYSTYPLVGSGRESIYSSLDEGSISAANDLQRNQFDVARYRPARLPSPPTWSENPYNAGYWRFEFYALRPTLNLLYAFRTTGNAAYARQLRRIDASFIAAEDRSRWAWVNPHAVAFRAMALVDTWWKLRQGHQLPEGEGTALLRELEKTGMYLADPDNYQGGENHGANEAAALYELAVAFPTLPHAREWLALAEERFRWQLGGIIDADGQLIENSPFYDFYTLEKYWQIYSYSIAQGQPMSNDFETKLRSMLNFATYILQPNSQVPLLGASIETTINDFGVYAAMASSDPHFRYVLTHGAQGSVPPRKSEFFPASNLTVMRSGWPSGPAFSRSTYLTYNIGRYRTAHSDLDALGLTLYGDGGDLLQDPGLFTYSSDRSQKYFHGTMSHNTVVVDGKSQVQGAGSAGPLVTKDGITYQAGESSLYEGVQHRRLVMMLDPDHVLVVDQLRSRSVHRYQQMFHLFPGARLSKSSLTVSGTGGTPRREVTIQQLLPAGISEDDVINRRGRRPDGLCAEQFGKLLPCYSISYSARRQKATFATLITIGQPRRTGFSINVGDDGRTFRVVDGARRIGLSLGSSRAVAPTAWATDPVAPPANEAPVPAGSGAGGWTAAGAGILSSGRAAQGTKRAVTSMSSNSESPAYLQNDAIRLDLRRHNARLGLKVTGLGRVSELRLELSNDHWAKWVSADALTAYTPDHAGQWLSFFLGPSAKWGPGGGWNASAAGFNWARIDGIRIELVSRNNGGRPVTVSSAGLALVRGQQEGKLAFVFDDGYQSILAAASYLHKHGMPGNVAVTGEHVDYPIQDYLNMFQLKTLQDKLGWDMVNHGQNAGAPGHRGGRRDLRGYAEDILRQARWLEANGLNSAPNWFIYPDGQTTAQRERIVSRYYMFARVVSDDPDAYPYGDPHAISDLEIQYKGGGAAGGGAAGGAGFTRPSEVLAAVRQAVRYHMTLILTFNRIHSQPGDDRGYPLSLFKRIVDGIHSSGIRVLTLSELDRSNGVAVRNHIYGTSGSQSQITVQIHS
jgi:Heparinase II/III-like protein/Heparinase II/III N-terminus